MSTLEKKVMTLCILQREGRVLLGMKKHGLGEGRWNGFGGKVKTGERVEDAARREMQEEAGVEVGGLVRMGICEFSSPVRPYVVEMHIFSARDFAGEPAESDEMRPQWFAVSDLPKADMWESDLFWWPYFLSNKKFTGQFQFDENDAVVLHDIQVVEQLP